MEKERNVSNPPLSIERAILSVSDKRGIVELAGGLRELGCDLISTGGTGRTLQNAGISYTKLSKVTGFPEIMDGRVKSLHPLVHGGILSRRSLDADVVAKHGIGEIDLVVANLYPFEETTVQPDCTLAQAIETIDIGGPAMIRAAAKNNEHVLAVVDPDDYTDVLARFKSNSVDREFRRAMAAKAFRHTAAYDATIAQYLTEQFVFPEALNLAFRQRELLRYGENPHQRAALYARYPATVGSIAAARQLQGKHLSYNNIVDSDAANACVQSFELPACVIVKHGIPCGVAIGSDPAEAYRRAFSTDRSSAYGGIIAFNVKLDRNTLVEVIETQFADVVLAPVVASEAVEVAKRRKNLRLLETGFSHDRSDEMQIKQIDGGLLVQDADSIQMQSISTKCVTERKPSDQEKADLEFAWQVSKFVKSNAIVLARDNRTVGIGAGQTSRVVSVRIAAMKARDEKLETNGCALASDAYFPFRDGLDVAAQHGVTAVIQPGGSIRDDEVIQAANERGMAMLFTGVRHFRH